MKTPSTTTKTPRTVEVKVALPWIIILVLATALAATVLGWNMRSSQVQEVRSQVSAQLESVAKTQTPKE